MPPFIKVEGLHKQFGNHVIIDNLSLEIAAGEIVVFQGPSGIGKSTFLRCLTLLEPFQKGRLRVGPITVEPHTNELDHHHTVLALRRQLGFVFQSFHLFPHLSVLDNLTIGPIKVLGEDPDRARPDAMQLLLRVGLDHKANAYPQTLSGGQQQRVAIARALSMNPKAVLFDEPTSSLDPTMKVEIVKVMEEFARDGLTMLIVTHEPHFAERIATRTITFGEKCHILT